MMVIFARFREPADREMKYIADFVNSGKPILGIRTATHAFAFEKNKQSAYARYDWRIKNGREDSASRFSEKPGSPIMGFMVKKALEALLTRPRKITRF